MEEKNENKKHLTSAERQELYKAHAASAVSAELRRKKKARTLRIAGIAAGVLLLAGLITALILMNNNVWKPARTYADAEEQYAAGKYLDAYKTFLSLGDYEDSADRAYDCIRANARALTGRDDAVIAGSAEMPWFSIDESGVLGFDKDLYQGDGHLQIPDIFDNLAVLGLKDKSFFYCDFLLSVEIPATVQSIGERTFFSCTSITELTLPDSVSFIGVSAFAQCTSLEKITLGSGLRTLSNSAFLGCSALKELTLPEGVTAIEPRTFNNCIALQSLTLPASLTSIGNFAFTGCNNIQKIHFHGTSAAFDALCAGDNGEPLRACISIQYGN